MLDSKANSIKEKEIEHHAKIKKLRSLEMKNQALADSLEEINQKLYGGDIKNVKELTQYEKQMQNLSDEKDKLEDLILQQMEILETMEQMIKQEKKEYEKEAENTKKLGRKAKEESSALKSEYKKLTHEIEALIDKIPHDYLKRYQALKKQLGDQVVCKVKNGVCLGCRVSLSSSVIGKLYIPGIELTCENCGRIIFLDKD